MAEIIIACKMIEKEVELARAKTGNNSKVIYLDRDLHEYPDNLRESIQEAILSVADNTEYILLAYGLCGNAMNHVYSPGSTLVVPRFHDCIHMMLVTNNNPRPITRPDCLYYTDGWFDSDNTLLKQYERFAARKGEVKAKRAYTRMLENYKDVCLIDVGTNYTPRTIEGANKTSDLFNLKLSEIEGSTSILERLFAHDWDEDFLICPPGTPISQNEFLQGGCSIASFTG